ncbi:hypothetical protein V2J09_023143 [Rumex salicifolius]
MKRRVRGLIKRIIAALSTKTNELRTRIMIFFLLHRNQSLLLDKFQAVVAGRRKAAAAAKQSLYCDDDDHGDGEGESFVMYMNTEPQVAANLDACNPTAKQLSSYAQESNQEEDKCMIDLTHILFKESEEEMKKAADNEIKASMNTRMEIVEDMGDGRLKEEEEEEDIDRAADVFIQRFRRQILLQKQLSLQESRSPTRILQQNL